jgi:hypothetical protein
MTSLAPPSRRGFLVTAGGLAIGLALSPQALWAATREAAAQNRAGPFRALLDELSDIVIPPTDTPGARAAGVPAFVETAIAHGLRSAKPDLLQTFATALNNFATGTYLTLPPERRVVLLTDIDTRTFANPPDAAALPAPLLQWPTLKALIVIGYYTSEIGGSQELRYELTPGHFDPDVPLKPGDRDWSSDWVGVKYA